MTAYKTKQNALKDFEIDSLDASEMRDYLRLVFDEFLDKQQALQSIIDSANGNYSLLSPDLAALAQEIENL